MDSVTLIPAQQTLCAHRDSIFFNPDNKVLCLECASCRQRFQTPDAAREVSTPKQEGQDHA